MKRASSWVSVLLVVVAVSGLSAASKRAFVIEMRMPNGADPVFKVVEGSMATAELKEGKFGFVPAFRAGDESTVVVEVFDLQANPHRKLGQVDVAVSGDAVQSDTTPMFSIRVSRVTTDK